MERLENAVVFSISVLGVEPHKAQIPYLLSQKQTKVIVGGRRSGKSHALAIEVCYHAALAVKNKQPFKQLLVAPTVDQTKLLFNKVTKLLKDSALAGLIENEVYSPFPELKFPYGGSIFVRSANESGKNLRGHSADRVIVDEAAYLQDLIILEAITPILTDSGGDLVLASTPTAKGSLFHAYFERGQTEADINLKSFHFLPADNPHIDHEFIENQKQNLTDAQFQIEYLGRFLDQTNCVFPWNHIVACATGEPEAPITNHQYVVGFDPAIQRDRSGVVVLDITCKPGKVVHLEDIKNQDYVSQTQYVVSLAQRYSGAKIVLDQTGHGLVLADLLRSKGAWVEGVTFTQQSKAELILELALVIEKHEITFPNSPLLIEELRFYESRVGSDGRIKYGAPEGGKVHDDLTTALALALKGNRQNRQIYQADSTVFNPPIFCSSNFEEPSSTHRNIVGQDGLIHSWSDWSGL